MGADAGVVGLDTICFAVPTTILHKSVPAFQTTRRGGIVLPGGGSIHHGATSAYIEASLPRRRYGSNILALPVRDLDQVVADLLDEVGHYLVLPLAMRSPRQLRVTRLDLVRDFTEVQVPGDLIHALGCLPRGGRVQTSLHRRGKAWETLEIRTRWTWSARLYDKHTESGGFAAPGALRFELQLRSKRMRSAWARDRGGHIGVVADVTQTKVDNFARSTFEEHGLDTPILSRAQALVSTEPLHHLRPQQ